LSSPSGLLAPAAGPVSEHQTARDAHDTIRFMASSPSPAADNPLGVGLRLAAAAPSPSDRITDGPAPVAYGLGASLFATRAGDSSPSPDVAWMGHGCPLPLQLCAALGQSPRRLSPRRHPAPVPQLRELRPRHGG